ncbi:MAG: right-handed parallel beta-helix repeat-containing protein [Abitibacteriaceae bacterium]|nr:right-handed parallel beta-helix repeat-containing protein [Abditibacteriaceae bacterium]
MLKTKLKLSVKSRIVGLMAVGAGLSLALSGTAQAQVPTPIPPVYTVTTTSDNGLNSAPLTGSLRWAMTQANAVAGATITFNIPQTDTRYDAATGAFTITPISSALPPINANGTTLDGSSQPVYAGDSSQPKIVLQGPGVQPYGDYTSGLIVNASNCVIKDLTINNFPQHGIAASGGSNTITGCYLGTDATGTVDQGNGGSGIFVYGAGITVGGSGVGAGNTIAFNHNGGVYLSSFSGNTVQGNNIFNNIAHGIVMDNNSTDNTIQGNLVQANQGDGVVVGNGSRNAIRNNTIQGNVNTGVVVGLGTGNSILGNSISDNGGLGIDLGANGVTLNQDDGGNTYYAEPNNNQNFPVLTSALSSLGSTTVTGTLSSHANQTYTVEFFTNATAEPVSDTSLDPNGLGYGEGQTFLGSTTVTTDSTGVAAFTANLSIAAPANSYVTATATDAGGDTSEFSQEVQATPVTAQVSSTTPVALGSNTQMQFNTAPAQPLTVTVTALDSTTAPPPPSGFQLGSTFYDISLATADGTKVTNPGGYVYITANYDPTQFADPNTLQFLHYNTTSAQWENITYSNDTSTGTIVGRAQSFSPFALAVQITSTPNVKVTGGGAIAVRNSKDSFGFVVMTNASSQPQGNLTFQDRATGLTVNSTTIKRVIVNGTRAVISGQASINGGATCTFQATVEDKREPGVGADSFSLQLSTGYSASNVLKSGNIQIHKPSHK